MTEEQNRIAKRNRVLKSAKIVLDDWRAIDCIVRDVSETGAKLATDSALSAPETFRLVMLSDNTIRPVKVVWRKEGLIGIHFTGAPTKAPLRKF